LFATVLAIGILSAGLWIGLPGLWLGGRIGRVRGLDHLMHYPVGVPWFRGKVNTAKWVVRTGRIYVGGALGLAAMILTASWWPASDMRSSSPCIQLTPLTEIGEMVRAEVTHVAQGDEGDRCHAEVKTADGDTLILTIEVDAPASLLGASLESQRTEMERQTMLLRPLPSLGHEAVLARHPAHPQRDVVFLFKHGRSTARVRLVDAPQNQLNRWVQLLASLKIDSD